MRTDSSSLQNVRGNGMPGPRRLDEIFDSIIVMRWYLKEALHEASDVPEAAAESLERLASTTEQSARSCPHTVHDETAIVAVH